MIKELLTKLLLLIHDLGAAVTFGQVVLCEQVADVPLHGVVSILILS